MTRPLSTIALLALLACGTPAPPPVEPDQTVATVAPAAPEVVETAEFVGVITTRKSEIVPIPFGARLIKLDVHPGQRIRKGEQIGKLDDADLKADIAAAISDERAGLAQAGADGTAARVAANEANQLERARRKGAVSGAAVAAKRGEAASAASRSGVGGSQAKAARARREPLERQLAQASIVAPLDGVVMMVKAKEGQMTQKGEPIARVFDPSDLLIRFAVPKEFRKQLALGGRVELRIDGVERSVWATIDRIADEEAPINFAVVDADIDDSKLAPDELRIASVGRVYLADNKVTARKAVR